MAQRRAQPVPCGEKRTTDQKNIFCIQCRKMNACGIKGHIHVYIGMRIRPPRVTASKQQWRSWFKKFAWKLNDPCLRFTV